MHLSGADRQILACADANQAKTTTECDYLVGDGPEGMGPLRHIALYHCHDPGRSKGVFVLHLAPEQR